jgi:hypothetical protein
MASTEDSEITEEEYMIQVEKDVIESLSNDLPQVQEVYKAIDDAILKYFGDGENFSPHIVLGAMSALLHKLASAKVKVHGGNKDDVQTCLHSMLDFILIGCSAIKEVEHVKH